MSFLSDLFSGNFSGLGQDLTSQVKQIGGSNTLEDLGIGAALVTGGLGLAGVGPAAALGALGVAGGAAGVGAGATDLSALGAADLGLGLVPGSLDALSATGTTAGDVGSLGTLPGVTDTTTGALTSAPPVATSAANFAAPQGVTSTLGIDPTAANAGNSIDAAAGQPGAIRPFFFPRTRTDALALAGRELPDGQCFPYHDPAIRSLQEPTLFGW